MSSALTQSRIASREQRRVAAATIIGTTVEWYDFFVYATAVGLIFSELFFKPAGEEFAAIVSFATVGVSFLFRPLGAFLAGHFGDVIGRRAMLVITLIVMGAATTLIGVLPTYEQAGLTGPILLVVLRIFQGLSTGGEWGGAVLMAVEHAPTARRGMMGAFPQAGVPLGMLLASGVMALMTGVISPGAAFAEWGWRVPFLLSIILILVGLIVRHSVEESPVFEEIKAKAAAAKMPVAQLFKQHWVLVLLAAMTFAGNNAAGYMTTGGFLQRYATTPLDDGGVVGLEPTPVLLAITAASVIWLAATMFGGWVSDRIGRRTTYLIGWVAFLVTLFALFPLVETGNIWLLLLGLAMFTVGNGLTYGPQSAYFAELFPASIRYSGVSISYAIGAILGGAFAPLISQVLVQTTGTSWSVVVYLGMMMLLALTATLILRDRTGIDLGPDNEAEQARRHTYFTT